MEKIDLLQLAEQWFATNVEFFRQQVKEEERKKEKPKPNDENDEWVDLGLPSGKLWKKDYEQDKKGKILYLTWGEANENYSLPSQEDFEELIVHCDWLWRGDGYRVTGRNKNSIWFFASGYHYLLSGSLNDVGTSGYSWSSASSSVRAFTLYFDASNVFPLHCDSRMYGLPVRLCKDKEK